jgi:hypothetical protein
MKKFEKEIRDLLDNLDNFVPDGPPPDKERAREREREPEREVRKTRPVGVMPQPVPIRPKRTTSGRLNAWLTEHHIGRGLRWMLGGLLVVCAAMVIGQLSNGSLLWLAQIVGAIGGLMFLAPLFSRFFKGKEMDEGPQYWRGQAVENDSFSWGSVKGWFNRGKRDKNNWDDRNRRNRW